MVRTDDHAMRSPNERLSLVIDALVCPRFRGNLQGARHLPEYTYRMRDAEYMRRFDDIFHVAALVSTWVWLQQSTDRFVTKRSLFGSIVSNCGQVTRYSRR